MTTYDTEVTPVTDAVISQLTRAHAHAVRPIIRRRRSLTSAMTTALLASWSVVEDRLDDHLLVTMTILRATPADRATGQPERTLYEDILDGVSGWLEEFASLQAITWQTPTSLMARTLLATFDGLILDFAATRDSDGARQLIELLGYHLAQSGLRRTKVVARGVYAD